MEPTPTHRSDRSQKIWPCPDDGAAGDWKPCPAGMPTADNVGYPVQPEPAAPPSTKNEKLIMTNAGHSTQYDIMLSFGNAMSGAPIISGIVKLPKAPVRNG